MNVNRQALFGALVAAFGLCVAAARAEDDACRAVAEALIKQATTPVHESISMRSAIAPGRARQSEVIRMSDAMYLEIRGQWMMRPYDGQKAADRVRQDMRDAEQTCRHVRSEAIDGQPAELYSTHAKTGAGTVDTQIWISAANGLPLRLLADLAGQGAGKSQHDIRFDYKNVTPPAGVAH